MVWDHQIVGPVHVIHRTNLGAVCIAGQVD